MGKFGDSLPNRRVSAKDWGWVTSGQEYRKPPEVAENEEAGR